MPQSPSPSSPDARLQLLADSIKHLGLEIFDGPECPQMVRDAIEWFAAELSVSQLPALESLGRAEPVAWMRTNGSGTPVITEEFLKCFPNHRSNFTVPLYASPALQQQEAGGGTRCNVTPSPSADEWLREHEDRHDGGSTTLEACQAANILRDVLACAPPHVEPIDESPAPVDSGAADRQFPRPDVWRTPTSDTLGVKEVPRG